MKVANRWVVCPHGGAVTELQLSTDEQSERVVRCNVLNPPTLISCGTPCLDEDALCATCPSHIVHVENGDVSFYIVMTTRAQLPDPDEEKGFGN